MKRTFVQLLSILCAVYFLMAGTGYNLVRYCCGSCENEGIESVVMKTCASVHHNHHEEGETCCHHSHEVSGTSEAVLCSDVPQEMTGCYLYRIQTDTPSLISNVNFTQENNIVIDFNFLIFDLFLATNLNVVSEPVFTPPDNIPIRTGRDVLAHHAVLLI